jgi:KDEL-tailed cysteine endopeptidase
VPHPTQPAASFSSRRTLALLIVSAAGAPTKDYAKLFGDWKVQHNKAYADAHSEANAFAAWARNDEKIDTHNAKKLSYTLGHNIFSDLTGDEFFAAKLGFNSSFHRQRTYSQRPLHIKLPGVSLPTSVDWVASGAVTGVKNQGSCGSCWAFSTTGAIEGAYAIATGSLTSLSEEDLVQCDTTDSGCSGGLMDNAFRWVESHGIASEAAYPYTSSSGTSGTCSTSKSNSPVVTISGYTDVTSEDEDALLSAVAQQPVSVAIEADKSVFQLYSSGVFDSSSCGTSLDHGVLVVGYGTDSSEGKEYWKVKNSWGTTWGEDGYIRMVRGSNMCGVATEPSYPTGASASSSSAVEAA